MAVAIVADFSFFISSAVQKCMCRAVVTTNGIPFTYMMSASIVTLPCRCITSIGNSWIVVTTLIGFFRTVLPCGDPIFAPKMSSARRMSALLIGQLGIMFRSRYLM